MTRDSARDSSQGVRLWPGVLIIVFQWFATFGVTYLAPGTMLQGYGMMAGPAFGLLFLLIWWIFFSRATKAEKILGALLPPAALIGTAFLAHQTMLPMGLFIYGIPVVCLAFVLTVALTRSWPATRRRLALALAVIVASGLWALVRSDGVDGYFQADFSWRFQKTPEQRLLEEETDLAALTPPSTSATDPSTSPTPDPAAGESPVEANAEAESGEAASTGEATETDSSESAAETDPAAEAPASDISSAEASITEASTTEIPALEEAAIAEDQDASPWPGFRGADRSGVIHGLQIATDWQSSPPTEIWRRPVGPGWGSFVVLGDLIYTQEQRGEEEVVAAYRAETGEPVWMHRDQARFWESLAGAGPRATPELRDGRLYSLGATGILNVLDAVTGTKIWSRDTAADSGAPLPEWGFSSSPLLIDDLVVIYTGAPDGKAVAAYDAASGEPRWFAPSGPNGYSSVHLATLHGEPQLLVLTDEGVSSHAPGDGSVLWNHEWKASGARCVQPAFAADGDPLIGTGFGVGLRRLDLDYDGQTWNVAEQWTTTFLKPYFNDFVVHKGHAYGFDGRILASVDLETGERNWKGGRYGHGQLVLLADQDILLVLSEKGELALVRAEPSGFEELSRMRGIKGKTWNHPIVADGVLYVRNAEEMAAFRLPTTPQVATLP